MANRLTDKQKKLIIANYVECENISAVAKRFGISRDTVKRIVNSDGRTAQIVTEKRVQNTADILAHMDSKKDAVCGLIDSYLAEMGNTEKIKKTGIQQLATSMAIVIDKFTATAQNDTALKKLDDLISKIDDEAGRK